MHTITISNKPFNVEPRYAAGHVLTENEASALNQTLYENLRNNFAKQAKEGADQEAFDKYAVAYQFGVRVGGGGSTRDPVQAQAIAIAKDRVKAQIQKLGKKLSDFTAAKLTTLAQALIEKDPSIVELAKARVEELRSMATAELDDSELLAAAVQDGDANDSDASGETEGSTDEASNEPRARGRRG